MLMFIVGIELEPEFPVSNPCWPASDPSLPFDAFQPSLKDLSTDSRAPDILAVPEGNLQTPARMPQTRERSAEIPRVACKGEKGTGPVLPNSHRLKMLKMRP